MSIILNPSENDVAGSMPIPLVLWQNKANSLFYNRESSPLSYFGTLGQEPLIAKAVASHYEKFGLEGKLQEIGPGNFAFALNFLNYLGKENLAYKAYDFSESSFDHVQEKIRNSGRKIDFRKMGISEFSNKEASDGSYVILVEILDDIGTQFVTRFEGKDYTLWVNPFMSKNLKFPSKSLAGRIKSLQGDFSRETFNLLGRTNPEREYSSSEIISMMCNPQRWEDLSDIYPDFLDSINYKYELMPKDISELFENFSIGNTSEAKEFEKAVLRKLDEQLNQVKVDPQSIQIAHLPFQGINFLWNMRNLKNTHVQFFDYGYSNMGYWCEPFSKFCGQITAPVNFELMQFAADYLGFNTKLEPINSFITEQTGIDSRPIGRLISGLKDKFPSEVLKNLMFKQFSEEVTRICPEADCYPKNILEHRITRRTFDQFIEAGKEQDIIRKDYDYQDGHYRLYAHK